MASPRIARTYVVRGRVQGVGFRNFALVEARKIGVAGWVRNLDDGNVEVYATGTAPQLSEFAGRLWKGPRWADVHGVEEREEALREYSAFQIRH